MIILYHIATCTCMHCSHEFVVAYDFFHSIRISNPGHGIRFPRKRTGHRGFLYNNGPHARPLQLCWYKSAVRQAVSNLLSVRALFPDHGFEKKSGRSWIAVPAFSRVELFCRERCRHPKKNRTWSRKLVRTKVLVVLWGEKIRFNRDWIKRE